MGENGGTVDGVRAAVGKGHAFGMELNGQNGPAGTIQCLDDAAFRPGNGPKTFAQAVYRLVMDAVNRKQWPVKLVEHTPLQAAHRVNRLLVFRAVEDADVGGEILNEIAPQGHIDDLHAPADAQNGLVGLIKGTKQLQLGLVPGHVGGIGALVFLAEE